MSYLPGPGGSYRHDTTTGTASEVAGSVIDTDQLTLISCNETPESQVLAETDSGPVVLSALTGPDVSNGAIRLSPDLSRALVETWGLDRRRAIVTAVIDHVAVSGLYPKTDVRSVVVITVAGNDRGWR